MSSFAPLPDIFPEVSTVLNSRYFTFERRAIRAGGRIAVFEGTEFAILGFFVTFFAKKKSKERKVKSTVTKN